jgi:response regulator RpfG family c-di-GMP phosphodiesterase
MVGVPGDLLTRRAKLSSDELARVRAQARVGAEIVRASHDFATARLIERQYDDYIEIRQTTVDSREVLLSGLLRVADVYDAMTAPRPYQPPLPEAQWRQVLQLGSGSKFHPAAVYALFRWADAARAH